MSLDLDGDGTNETYPYTEQSPYGNPDYPMPASDLVFSDGEYDFEVVMYSIAPTANERTVYFRLYDDTLETYTELGDVTEEWNHTSGLLSDLANAATSYPFAIPYDRYDSKREADAWQYPAAIMGCVQSYFNGLEGWEDSCSWD